MARQEDNGLDAFVLPSRSEKKRQAEAIEDFARELAELKVADIAALPASDEIRREILVAASLKDRGARKRQVKFLARCLRTIHPDELESIQEHMARRHDSRSMAVERDKDLEKLRNLLLDPETRDMAYREVERRFPRMDIPGLRHLVERCSEWAPPRFAKDILRRLRLAADRQGPKS